MTSHARRKGSYGLDAPYMLVIPPVVMVFYLVWGLAARTPGPLIGVPIMGVCAFFGWYASRRGKFVVWDRVLDQIQLRGDERLLDLGCGRGAVLLMAAERLTTGRAVGVDLWRTVDQSGNAAEATERNAQAEGVADRVELHTADMTALPFEPDSFDIIVSNIAIHNIKKKEDRRKAIDEAVRVLRPGGRLAIADLFAIHEYRDRLNELRMSDITLRNLGWRMWWGGPWMPTRLLTAVKPRAGADAA
jgi:arsenite methyltransferase